MMRFTKMQGLGNDYLYVFGPVPERIEAICRRISDRHLGVGSDGMIFMDHSGIADFSMRIFNADGSEAKMCGNGIRCVGKYLFDKGLTDKTHLKIETLSGVKTLSLTVKDGLVRTVSVDMGVATAGEETKIDVCGRSFLFIPVDVGNPHAVFFTANAEKIPLNDLGPAIEHDAAFPGGVNAEFVHPLSQVALRMRVWERGSGITRACGTGACAAAAAAVKKGLCAPDIPITVRLDGGDLTITVFSDGRVMMTGPAETVFEGECDLC